MAILKNFPTLRPLVAVVACTFALTSWARPLPLWELQDADSRVLIMGSVHLLRASDYPLREGLDKAYELADTVTMEIDMGAIDPAASQQTITAISIDPEGKKLSDLVGERAYNKANNLAEEIGIPLMMFDQFEPWFVALSITQLRMVQLGFDPAWGVETMFTRKALAENKQLAGLETLEEQLGFLDRLDIATQKKFLLQALEEAATVQDEVDTIVNAWTAGDVAELEKSLLKGLDEAPALYDALLVQRNKNWVAPIQKLLDDPGVHLVIVGTMHLVGENNVLDLLAAAGTESTQLSDADF